MKRLFTYIAALTLMVSCSSDGKMSPTENCGKASANVSITFQTKAGGAAPAVNSLRLLAFNRNGQCNLNTLLTGSDFTITPSAGLNGYELTTNDPVEFELSNSDNYNVYAILNESGHILDGTESTLASLLAEITVGSNSQLAFSNYYSRGIEYVATPVPGTEPAFLMSAFKNVTIPAGSSEEPYQIDFSAAEISQRPLAQVTVNGITSSEATADDVQKIVILDVAIEKIPSSYSWSANNGVLGTSPVRIPLGTRGASGIYSRDTDGSLTVTSTRQLHTNASCYSYVTGTGKDAVYGWSFDHDSAYGFNNDKAITDNVKRAAVDATALSAQLDGIYADPSNISSTTFNITSQTINTTPATENWTITLGQAYYLPENISTGSENATCIHVKAAIADVVALTSGIMPTTVDLSVLGFNYIPTGTETYKNNSKALTVYASNENGFNDLVSPTNCGVHSKLHAVVSGFYRESTGTTELVTASIGGTQYALGSYSHVYDFYIPINNNQFDSDYSVRRNTKYSVTLHACEDTYAALETKSGIAEPGFNITASVESEKLNDYED